jgi:hypothetical protein
LSVEEQDKMQDGEKEEVKRKPDVIRKHAE